MLAAAFARKSEPLQAFIDLFGGRQSRAGRTVNWETALSVSTAIACARVIAEGIALPPLKLMRDTGGTRLPAKDHPLFDRLYRAPNPFQTAFEFWESAGMHLVFTGNAYVYKNAPLGTIRELLLLEPGPMTVTRGADGALKYEYRKLNGQTREIPATEMWHIRGPSWNTWSGLDCVQLGREALGLSLAIEETQAKFYANGARPSSMLSVDGSLQEGQYKTLRDWLDKEVVGSQNTGKPLIMDRAAKFHSLVMTGVDAQLLETRRFQIEEVCRAFRVMPIMVGYTDKAATYASAVEMFVQHVRGSLAPWYERIEQSIECNLLTQKERDDGLYANFTEEALLRGSPSQTKDMILDYVNGGVLTPNEGRELIDRNPDADPESNKLRVPANIVGAIDKPKPGAKPGG